MIWRGFIYGVAVFDSFMFCVLSWVVFSEGATTKGHGPEDASGVALAIILALLANAVVAWRILYLDNMKDAR